MSKLFKVIAMNVKTSERVKEITNYDLKEVMDQLINLNLEIYGGDILDFLEYEDVADSMYLKAIDLLDKKGFLECGDFCICKADHKEDVRIPFICDIEKLM